MGVTPDPRKMAAVARRASLATGKRFVVATADGVVAVADTLSDLAVVSAVSNVDVGEVLEVTGSVVTVVAEVAGGIISAIGDA